MTGTVTGQSRLSGATLSDSFSISLLNPLNIDYLQELFGTRNNISYFLSESSWDSDVLQVIESLDSFVELDFSRSNDNTNTVLDIYIDEGSDSGWKIYEYDNYIELYLEIADGAGEDHIEDLVGEMLGFALGLTDSNSLDQAGLEELLSVWGHESGEFLISLVENETIEAAIEQHDEVDIYELDIQEHIDGFDQYLTLNFDDPLADLDL